MLRRILVPVRGDGMGEALFAHAAKLAHLHKGHIVVAHSRAEVGKLAPYGRTMTAFAKQTMLDQAKELADQEEQALRDDLHRQAVALDILETDTPDGTRATVSFVEETGRMADVIKHNGRLPTLSSWPNPIGIATLASTPSNPGCLKPGGQCSCAPKTMGRMKILAPAWPWPGTGHLKRRAPSASPYPLSKQPAR